MLIGKGRDVGTEVDHVTRDSDATFKVNRQKAKVTMQAALLTTVLARQAAAAVGVITC